MSAHLSRRTVTTGLMATLASGAFLSQGSLRASAAVPSTAFTFTDSVGTASSARFYPANSTKTGLVVYLDDKDHTLHDKDHDGNDADFPGGLTGAGSIVEAATARGYDVVSVHAPTDDGLWTSMLAPKAVTHFTELFSHVQSSYEANPAVLWLVGYAAGADFITREFFPRYANTMTGGGFLALGGGEAPSLPGWGGEPSQHATSTLSLNLVTGEKDETAYDNAINNAKSSFDYYKGAGFEHVWATWPPDLDHASIVPEFGSYLGTVLDAYQG